jgi:hypothetical protein
MAAATPLIYLQSTNCCGYYGFGACRKSADFALTEDLKPGLHKFWTPPHEGARSIRRERPFKVSASSPAAISGARSRSPKAGALLHFLPKCMTSHTHSAQRPSSPNRRFPENQRWTRANLPVCRSGSAQRAPEFRARCLDHRYYAVRVRQPFLFILLTASVGRCPEIPTVTIEFTSIIAATSAMDSAL